MKRGGFPWRGFILGMALLPLAMYWAVEVPLDVVLSLMVPPVILTFAAVLANRAPGIRAPHRRLTEADLVTLYSVLAVGTAAGASWTSFTEPLIYAYSLFATPGNRYETRILPYLPGFLFVKDAGSLQDFKQGGKDFAYFAAHLHLWWGPVLAWTTLLFLAGFAMLCINHLMQEQWTQREKLSFPIIQLPLAITENGGRTKLWRSRPFQIGFLLFFAIDVLDGLHIFFPALPTIPVRFLGRIDAWATGSPWNAIGWTPIGLFPFIVAIGTFLPTDLLFSVFFFFAFRKAQQITAASMGYPQGVFGGGGLTPSAPYFSEQTWGAFLALFCTVIWVARDYLGTLRARIQTGSSPGMRGALAGLVGSILGLSIIGSLAGLSPIVAAGYVLIYLVFSVVVTHMRAELGPPSHEMGFLGPNQLLVDVAGSRGFSPQSITVFAIVFHFANRIHRTDPMPSQLEAMKMAERSQLAPGGIFLALIPALALGPLLGYLLRLLEDYRWGAAAGHTWIPSEPAAVVFDLVGRPRSPNAAADLFLVMGFLMVLGLNALRFRFVWFPLNPVGYALAMNFGVDYYWFGLLIALLIKLGVQRYFGLRGYRHLHNLALGVILGEFCAETIWATVSMACHIAGYTVSINWEP